MQKLLLLTFVLALGLVGCAPEMPSATENDLETILAKGVQSARDFDVLQAENVYPFDQLSGAAIAEMKENSIFHAGSLQGMKSHLFLQELSENQALVLFQVIFHANPVFDNLPSEAFKQNLQRSRAEITFVPNDDYSSDYLVFGYVPAVSTQEGDHRCVPAYGFCNMPNDNGDN